MTATTVGPLVLTIVPVASAVVGGLLTMVGTALVERRRWRREETLREEQRRLDVRQATRLIERELWEAEQRLAAAGRATHYEETLMSPATPAWVAWHDKLARHLGVADWYRVTAAYDALFSLGRHLQQRAHKEPLPLAVEEADQLDQRWYAIRTASWILRAEVDEAEKLEHWLDEDQELRAEIFGGQNRCSGVPSPPGTP